jgi:autotransporter-associated beta strand protein
MKLRKPTLVFGALTLLLAASASAQTNYNWTSSTDGSWGTNTNWTVNGIPGTNVGDTATFNTASTGSTITLDGSRTLISVSFGAASTSWTINPGTDPASVLTVGAGAVRFTVTDTVVNFNAGLQGTSGFAADLRLSGDGGTVNFTGVINSRTQYGSLNASGTTGMIYNLNAVNIVPSRTLVGFHNGTTTINNFTGTTLNVNASQTTSSETRAAGGNNAANAGVIVIRNGATWTQSSDSLLLGFSGTNGTGVQHGRLEVGVVGDSTGNLTIGNSGNLVIASRSGSGILNINNGIVTVNANSDTATITLADQAPNSPNPGGNGTINLNAGGTLITARNFTTAANGTGTFNFDGGLLQINRATGNVTTDLFSGTGITVNVQNGGARIDTQANNTIINRALVGAGTGGLEKLGVGTLTLNGANTYTGNTTVTVGTLKLGSTGSISDSSNYIVNGTLDVSAITPATFTVAAGKTLSGTGTINATGRTLSIEGTHAAGGIGTVGSQAITGNLDYGTSSIFDWDLNANSTASGFDTVSATGDITVGASTVFNVVFGTGVDLGDVFWSTASPTQEWSMASIFGKVFTSGSFASVTSTADPITQGAFTITGGGSTLTWTAVPEPTSALAGLLLSAGLLRRRRAH